jgi:hypothetical protein
MAKKKRKIFRTPEERAEWILRGEAVQRMLQDRIDRITAELRARGQEVRDLGYWIERGSSASAPSARASTLRKSPGVRPLV